MQVGPGTQSTSFWFMLLFAVLSAAVALKIIPASVPVQADAMTLAGVIPVVYGAYRTVLHVAEGIVSAIKSKP